MPDLTAHKLIATNVARLRQKYGNDYPNLQAAFAELIAADVGRGLSTVLVDLSDAGQMQTLGARTVPVEKAGDPKSNKQAIDKVYAAFDRPDYLMLFGSVDVIPHQDLLNPTSGDPDDFAWSDLPYACDAAYSTDLRDFLPPDGTPSRVVGRLPDVTGGTDVNYPIGVLRAAARFQQLPASDYDEFLGVSGRQIEQSTEASLRSIFGSATGIKVSPPDGPQWSAAEFHRRAQYFNCHGAPGKHQFFGLNEPPFPVAHDATLLAGNLSDGTIAAAECCYSAQLFDPAGGPLAMSNAYLAAGACGYFGSTTLSYGPSVSTDWADLICQLFMRQVRGGASLGRACLQARLDYIESKSNGLMATDMKTLAQFNLLGDPSMTPAQAALALPELAPLAAGARALPKGEAAAAESARFRRREALRNASRVVASVVGAIAEQLPKKKVRRKALAAIKKAAAERGIDFAAATLSSHALRHPKRSATESRRAKARRLPLPSAVHTLIHHVPVAGQFVPKVRGIEAVEIGDVIALREFVSR
jgi:hypothetical protein